MTNIRIGDEVRLSLASGKYGDVTDIAVVYTANNPPAALLYITDIQGHKKIKWAAEFSPLHGTIKQDNSGTPAAESDITDVSDLTRHHLTQTRNQVYNLADNGHISQHFASILIMLINAQMGRIQA